MMQKVLLYILFILFVSGITACKETPVRYARIVNTDSSVTATRNKQSSKKAMTLEPNDTVQVVDLGKDYSKVRMGLKEGFISTDNLEIFWNQEEVDKIHKERNPISTSFIFWLADNAINILSILALLTIVSIIYTRQDPTFGRLMIQMFIYIVMVGSVIYLISTGYHDFSEQLELNFGDDEFGGHLFNVLKLTFYFLIVIFGYLNLGNTLLCYAGNINYKTRKKGLGLYLWMPALLVLVIWLQSAFKSDIPSFVLLALILWNVINNCRAVWPKIHYPIIVAVLGCAAGVAMLGTLLLIISQVLLLLLFGGIIIFVIANPSLLFDFFSNPHVPEYVSAPSSTDDYVEESSDYYPYDKVIKGGGMLGGDIRARENIDGSLTDESGGHWDNDGYGNYSKR